MSLLSISPASLPLAMRNRRQGCKGPTAVLIRWFLTVEAHKGRRANLTQSPPLRSRGLCIQRCWVDQLVQRCRHLAHALILSPQSSLEVSRCTTQHKVCRYADMQIYRCILLPEQNKSKQKQKQKQNLRQFHFASVFSRSMQSSLTMSITPHHGTLVRI